MQAIQTRNFRDCVRGPIVIILDGDSQASLINGRLLFTVRPDLRLENVIGFQVTALTCAATSLTQEMSLYLSSNRLGSLLAFNPFRMSLTPSITPSQTVATQYSSVIGLARINAPSQSVETQFSTLNPRFNFKQPTHIDSFDLGIETPHFTIPNESNRTFIEIKFFQACNC